MKIGKKEISREYFQEDFSKGDVCSLSVLESLRVFVKMYVLEFQPNQLGISNLNQFHIEEQCYTLNIGNSWVKKISAQNTEFFHIGIV